MRISDRLRYESFRENLVKIKTQIDRIQEIISSGKKVMRPGDDPVGFSVSVEFQGDQRKIEGYGRTIERLTMLGNYYDSSINKIHDLLLRAKEIAIQQGSDTSAASTRISAAHEVKGLIEQLVSIGNTTLAGIYIFSGKNLNTKPFDLNPDYSVTYNGTNDVFKVYIDDGSEVDLTMSGYSVFLEGANTFSILKSLKEALETNDAHGIRSSIGEIDRALEKQQANLSRIGNYVSRIERAKEVFELRSLELEEILSKIRDADLVRTISDFQILTFTYQSLIYSMAKFQELNILNYLR